MVVISQGDVCGIGWPTIISLLQSVSEHFTLREQKKLNKLVVVGDLYASDYEKVKKVFDVVEITKNNNLDNLESTLLKNKKPIFYCRKLKSSMKYIAGKPVRSQSKAAYEVFITSIMIIKKLGGSLVTLPVSKENIIKAGYNFAGHTEVLAKHFEPTVMCLYNRKLSVLLMTNHIPLKSVSEKIKSYKAKPLIKALHQFQTQFKSSKPFALLGLNPHCGEGGKIGNEERYLKKLSTKLRATGLDVVGPISGDGFFSPNVRKNYSLAIVPYHDLALAPFKALFGASGLNITLNLPFLRVSPDHGPAYERLNSTWDVKSILYSVKFAMNEGNKWRRRF